MRLFRSPPSERAETPERAWGGVFLQVRRAGGRFRAPRDARCESVGAAHVSAPAAFRLFLYLSAAVRREKETPPIR